MSEFVRLRQNDLVWQHVDDDLVVLDTRRSVYLRVSPTGRHLWQKLVDGTTPADLATSLVDAYSIDRADAARDVSTFLETLTARDLLDYDAGASDE